MNDILRVLIVDDDEVDRMAIRRHLSNKMIDADIIEAEDAATAYQYLTLDAFSCVILDYRLPDKDGISFVKQLRLEGFLLPIIVLTGQGDEKTAVELMKAGASDYLSKLRLSSDELTVKIRNAMKVFYAEQRTRAAQEQLRQTNALLKQQNRELEEKQNQIEQQNLQLLEANRHKSEFLATVTHELRTPLNSIMGFSQILRSQSKGPLNDYQVDMVERIFSNGENLLNLVNDILDMSTIEANQLDLVPNRFNLLVLVKETLQDLRISADRKGLAVEIDSMLEDPIVYNDRHRLKQVLTNLISNAYKFTDAGYVRIGLGSCGPNNIELRVEDTGIGISPEQIERIFCPFSQGDQTTRRRYPGTGLGLAIVHSLVSMMDGFVTVDSQVGQGTTFTISFPRRILAPEERASIEQIYWQHSPADDAYSRKGH